MAAPDLPTVWVANPELVTSAIKLLAGAVVLLGGALVSVVIYVWQDHKTSNAALFEGLQLKFTAAVTSLDAKIGQLATSMESLALTTSNQITKIDVRCEERHANHNRSTDPKPVRHKRIPRT